MTHYEPKYTWRPTRPDEDHSIADLDWIGLDGTEYLGRIKKETNGPTKDKWHWACSWPRACKGNPPSPSTGYAETARLATQKVEEYWERCHLVMALR